MKGYIQSSEEEIYFDIQEFCNYIFTFLTKNINFDIQSVNTLYMINNRHISYFSISKETHLIILKVKENQHLWQKYKLLY